VFRHLLQGRGHEMVDLSIHYRIVIFLYVKCCFSLVLGEGDGDDIDVGQNDEYEEYQGEYV
jgi:hypothetical protein